MGRMQDKVALVLGAAAKDNMGQAVARRLASEGAKVVVDVNATCAFTEDFSPTLGCG